MKNYLFIDCTEKYDSIMVFGKNKDVLVHRWYPFVEGYSKEFIEDILQELPFTPQCALEPFCGSGTFPIEAAMMAANIAPGMNRHFTAEAWKHLITPQNWTDVRDEARDEIIAAERAANVRPLTPTGVKLRTSQGYASSETLIVPWRPEKASGWSEI